VPLPVDRLTDPDAVMASEPTLSTLAILASEIEASSSSTQKFDDPLFSDTPGLSISGRTKEQMRKYYIRSLHKVVDQSDIILLVLDARDPEGCRSRLVEEEVRRRESEGKKLVFVLNKIGKFLKLAVYFIHSLSLMKILLITLLDLIPRSNAQQWLRHLRHSTPTLPFLSSASSHQRTNISSSTAPSLLKLLKAYKPKAGSITIGVVGYPNVGKSSLINSLKRSKV
jgi:nuclear GTP-binding protein